jgi:outer membrane protein assembly factor BamB
LDSGAAFSADGTSMYVASYKDGLFAIDTQTGDFLWNRPLSAATYVALRGDLLLTTGGFGISAYSAEEGVRIWNTPVLPPRPPTATRRKPLADKANSGMPPTLYTRWLLVPTSGDLGFFDIVSGKPMGYWNPGQGVSATPAVWKDRVYVLSNLGHLYSLKMVRWSS